MHPIGEGSRGEVHSPCSGTPHTPTHIWPHTLKGLHSYAPLPMDIPRVQLCENLIKEKRLEMDLVSLAFVGLHVLDPGSSLCVVKAIGWWVE